MYYPTQTYQHAIPSLTPGPRKGRNPREGYERACGLQFGNLGQLIRNDPDFQSAARLASNRTLLTPASLMNLFLLVKFHLPALTPGGNPRAPTLPTKGPPAPSVPPPSAIIEFGTYKGGSLLFLAALAQRFLPNTRLFGLDTFTGMPPTNPALDAHRPGDFADSGLPALRQTAAAAGLTNLELLPGRFEDTLPLLLPNLPPILLTHIDCDIYSAVAYAYNSIKPAMVPTGGYVVLDDPLAASCLGACEAMEELIIRRDALHAEQMFPHPVFRYPPIA